MPPFRDICRVKDRQVPGGMVVVVVVGDLGTVHTRAEVLTMRAGVVALKVEPPVSASRNRHRVVEEAEEEVENSGTGALNEEDASPEDISVGATATSLPPSTTTLGATIQPEMGGTKVKREEVEDRLSLHHVALSVRRRGKEREEEEERKARGKGGEGQVTEVMDNDDPLLLVPLREGKVVVLAGEREGPQAQNSCPLSLLLLLLLKFPKNAYWMDPTRMGARVRVKGVPPAIFPCPGYTEVTTKGEADMAIDTAAGEAEEGGEEEAVEEEAPTTPDFPPDTPRYTSITYTVGGAAAAVAAAPVVAAGVVKRYTLSPPDHAGTRV